MRSLLFLFGLLLMLSCHQEPIPCEVPECNPDTIPAEDSMKLLWSLPFNTTGLNELDNDLYLLDEDKIIITGEGDETVRCFSIPDSTYLWKYSGFDFHRYSSHSLDLNNKKFAGCYFSLTTSLNLETGEEYWQNDVSPFPKGNPRMSIIGDYFYHSHEDLTGANRFSSLVRKPLTIDQAWDTLFILDSVEYNNFSPGFIGPSLWMHPNTNDSILIIPVRMVEFDRNLRRSDVIAFNLNTREIMWQVEDFTGIVHVDQPIIHDDQVYVKNDSEIFAFKLLDGSLAWSFKETSQWANYGRGTLQVIDDKLIMVDNNGTVVYAIDPLSGQTIWRHDQNGKFASGKNGIVVYKNYIITGSFNKLDVFDVRDGKHVYQVRNTVRRFRGRMALDEANRKLYVPEESQIVAYELPEEF